VVSWFIHYLKSSYWSKPFIELRNWHGRIHLGLARPTNHTLRPVILSVSVNNHHWGKADRNCNCNYGHPKMADMKLETGTGESIWDWLDLVWAYSYGCREDLECHCIVWERILIYFHSYQCQHFSNSRNRFIITKLPEDQMFLIYTNYECCSKTY
jgi:hypothetical protein